MEVAKKDICAALGMDHYLCHSVRTCKSAKLTTHKTFITAEPGCGGKIAAVGQGLGEEQREGGVPTEFLPL